MYLGTRDSSCQEHVSFCVRLMTEYIIQYVLYNCSQGGKPGSTVRCNVCNGRGIKVTLRQLGPGMVQQMQTVCPECRGEGELQPFVQHCLLHQCDLRP